MLSIFYPRVLIYGQAINLEAGGLLSIWCGKGREWYNRSSWYSPLKRCHLWIQGLYDSTSKNFHDTCNVSNDSKCL